MTIPPNTDSKEKTIENEAERFREKIAHQDVKPFCGQDTTVGMEYELQVAVTGSANHVDLPLTIKSSRYFGNLVKRIERGDCSEQLISDLTAFLDQEAPAVWENSWVRLKTGYLSDYAMRVVEGDFLANKKQPDGPMRRDRHRFFVVHCGEQWLRLPISYVLKLSLADCIGRVPDLPRHLFLLGEKLQEHFISDNTSPEILSLTIADSTTGTIGLNAARESARTHLFSQLLLEYANSQFRLRQNGQTAHLYFAPLAPLRQKRLNDLVSDGFYRHLFMSPCLAGWDKGEEKHAYMSLCHKTLSRSQLNALAKLKDAGIITNNLVVLPNTSNTCLANNGIHVSLGSRVLSSFAADRQSGFSPSVEKHFGDLAIKIVEYFLPLLVGTFSAAPYRIDYADFHPEKVLGFLPHELDYTYLRMLWRRWKRKADISIFGTPVTPFGHRVIDRGIALLTAKHGDLIPDFRLIDYLVALLSTENTPSLNGQPGNQELLKRDLAELGVFDERMAFYLPYRLREYCNKGYAGFEGRFYSLFPRLLVDMRDGVDLQNLITALAYQLILDGTISHADIPDTPHAESERRQIFFAAAIGIPTFYVNINTKNRLLEKILAMTDNQRNSRRYKGYLRVNIRDYQMALLRMLSENGAGLVEQMNLRPLLSRLEEQVANPTGSAYARLTDGIAAALKTTKSPLSIPADQFNRVSERYYREELCRIHIEEGVSVLTEDCFDLEQQDPEGARAIAQAIGIDDSLSEFAAMAARQLHAASSPPRSLRQLILLCLALTHHQSHCHAHR